MGDLHALRATLRQFDRIVVAFSGGADSSFLAWVATDTLGADRVTCVTALSPSLASFEHEECARIATEWALNWLEVETAEMQNAAYRRNDADRCFWCKDALMDALEPIARERDAVVVLGVNVDDLGDHRPGQRAAAARGARFPLVDAGFTKSELRDASHALGLSTWDKPAAACLASRLPYGTPVDIGVLASVEAAESGLRALGFRDVRVRHYRDLARVEVPVADLAALLCVRDQVVEAIKAAGYRYVTVDLEGLRSGNLNAALELPALEGRPGPALSPPHDRR
jgi:uncharacterized protein